MEGIPVSEYRDRVSNCQKFARRARFDAILAYSGSRYSMGQGVESGQHIRYFVGFNFPPRLIQEEDVVVPYMLGDSLVVIPQEGEPSLLLSRQDPKSARAKNQVWLSDVRSISDEYSDQFSGAINRGLAELAREVLDGKRKARLGVAGTRFPLQLQTELSKVLRKSRFVECGNQLDQLRAIKTPNELRIMRKAAEIADEGVRAMIESSRPGVAEYEVHMAVEKAMFDAGGDNPWSVIQSGPRATISYMSPDYTQRKLRQGDMIYADIGSELMGYHSDIQPAHIVGKGNAKQLRIIEDSLNMLKAMFRATHPGATDTDVVKTAYGVMRDSPYRDYVRSWTLGHGYGVGSDPPDMTNATLALPKSNQMKLQQNMVLCLEPGIFVPEVGGAAVEDEVIITRDGCEVLTNCARRAEELLKTQRSA
jgi:Xaa-Pro dipeptidase